jgi:hypothetical protein
VTVSWFGSQNKVGYGLSVAPQNRQENEDGVQHASRSSGLLRLKASRARVSQLSHLVLRSKLNAVLYVCQDQFSHIKRQIVK